MLKTIEHFADEVGMGDWINTQKQSLRKGGTLNLWIVDDVTFSPSVVFRGYLNNDTYWNEGEYIRTSAVQYIGDDFIITLNTVYQLGEPREGILI
jgi:hypothetical protein